MLKLILGKAQDYSDRAWQQQQDADARRENTLDWLRPLIEFFPIGKRLRYCPEYKKEIVFDTFVVGYCINREFIYSGDAIERDSAGNPVSFHIARTDLRLDVSEIEWFQLVVPDTSQLELKLDYERRALIGRGRQFIKGNCISLTSSAVGQGAATLDTEVAKQITLDDGPYAQTKLIVLTPDLESLVVHDQRKKGRAKICVPVILSPDGEKDGEKQAAHGTIVDISDGAIRIRTRDADHALPETRENDSVVLTVNLAEAERQHTIKGTVIRRSPEICVVRVDSFMKNGNFVAFGPLNHMELKAELMNYVQ
jgi:hypothetical protein